MADVTPTECIAEVGSAGTHQRPELRSPLDNSRLWCFAVASAQYFPAFPHDQGNGARLGLSLARHIEHPGRIMRQQSLSFPNSNRATE